MMDLKTLELTDQDFQLLIDGLDSLPERGQAGEIMHSLLTGILTRDNEEAAAKAKREQEERMRKAEAAKQQQREDIRILQGKLLMLKRYLMQQGALKQAYDVLDNPTGKP